jgi:large subunit ribosomal protein L13
MGKDKPTYKPNICDGDIVVVKNAAQIHFTGRKWDRKLYRWHTGYPGGLRQQTAKDLLQKKPEDVLKNAVMGMLPKNNLRKEMNLRLRIFAGEGHPFKDHPQLTLFEMPHRNIRTKKGEADTLEIPEGFQPVNPAAFQKRKEMLEKRKPRAGQ